MIDAAVTLSPARDVVVVDLWEGELPAPLGRAMQVEPRRWWLLDGADDIETALGDRGVAASIGGGLVRATITGAGWRDLLSVSGFLDTEGLRRGDAASTVIHHVPVRILVTGEQSCEAFFASSYAGTLDELWQRAAKGG